MNIKASVVIPTFRRPLPLQALLGALVEQVAEVEQSDVVEIIVVDNCPEASARSIAETAGLVRYLHEPRTGIANARNRGVASARGGFVIFIDDDEMPLDGWLTAYLDSAHRGQDAYFGPIEPHYIATPPAALRPALERLFSRRLSAVDGQDITRRRAYLGTGNSMLNRKLCLAEPFEERFNAGGEDVWFLRRIVEAHGARLHWCAGARVREMVPENRMTQAFLLRRRFRSGQLRCIVESGRPRMQAVASVAFWMTVGLLQASAYGSAAVLLHLARRREAQDLAIRCMGGVGKLLWWCDFELLPPFGGKRDDQT
jgi:succinoglycan biosynthesis protein ExoM